MLPLKSLGDRGLALFVTQTTSLKRSQDVRFSKEHAFFSLHFDLDPAVLREKHFVPNLDVQGDVIAVLLLNS